MSDISPSKITTDAAFEKAVSECTSVHEISKLMHDREIQLGLVRRDEFNPEVLIPVEQPATAAPQTVTRTIEYNGQKRVITGNSADDLQKQEIAFFRSLEITEPIRDDRGRFTADHKKGEAAEIAEAKRISDAAELELAWKRGSITGAEYLERSGAIEEHLEKRGISVEALKAQTAEIIGGDIYEQSWRDAVTDFLRSPEGADWPGGPESLARATDVITRLSKESPNMEAENSKVEILKHVWSIMKRNDEQQNALENAKTPQEIRDALGIDSRARDAMQNRSSGFFGSR
jgi:hypothetical protein